LLHCAFLSIAAAHADCFAMAPALQLQVAGYTLRNGLPRALSPLAKHAQVELPQYPHPAGVIR
jgi:hypothetical protein